MGQHREETKQRTKRGAPQRRQCGALPAWQPSRAQLLLRCLLCCDGLLGGSGSVSGALLLLLLLFRRGMLLLPLLPLLLLPGRGRLIRPDTTVIAGTALLLLLLRALLCLTGRQRFCRRRCHCRLCAGSDMGRLQAPSLKQFLQALPMQHTRQLPPLCLQGAGRHAGRRCLASQNV